MQIIANLIVCNAKSDVLFVIYNLESEEKWLPVGDPAPNTRLDQTRDESLRDFAPLHVREWWLSFAKLCRGRRGWRLAFR